MPSLLDKLKNRWNSGAALAPNYGPIGPTAPRDLRTPWRQRLARWIGSGQSTPLRTASYRPLHQPWFNQPRDLPPFSFETINSMLLDPGIRLNLAMRAAPIYGVQFAYPSEVDASGKTTYQPGIQARNPAVAAWVARQLSTIWHNDLPAILRAQVYGWAGGEVSLRLSDQNFIEIDRLVARHPGDVRLLKCEGDRYGVKVLRVQEGGEVNLEFPSAWFHAFRPDDGEDYGTSILLGAYSPWADKWFNGGALDTRRLFMHKDAYGGMKIAYPEEDIYIGNEVNPVSARDIAAQMVEQRKAGGTITYPSTLDFQGNPKWRIEEATTANNPQHILQYPKDCDDEIRIGMEIPDDVISADGSGAWAGKRIPMAAFYASLDTWVVQLLADLRHTLEPLILLNWGRAEDFEICHKPLALQAMEQQGQAASQSANTAATTAQPTTTGQPPDLTAQAPMIAGSTPHRMSLSTRPSLSAKERQNRYERSRLIAALLTHIYGPDAERYFDEAFGTNVSGASSPSNIRHPHEFQRMSSQISRSISFNRVPWDPLKHPRGRDGRFIEKYGIDAFNQSKAKINASLDPNASPTTGRTSDEVRPLLEHLNLLDQSQLHGLLSEYLTSTPVTPDSFIHKVHYQVNGDEADDTQEDHETTEEEHLDSNNDVDLEGDEQDQSNDGVQTDYEEELETDDEAPSQETEPDSNEEGLNDEQQDGEESSEEEDSESEESTDQADGDTAESLEDESEDDQEDDADESEEGELLFGDSSAVESKPEIKRTGRSSQTARTPELPADKVLSGVLGSGGELLQSIADLPHDSFDGNKDSTRKIRNGRQQEQASVAVLTQLRDELYKTYAKYMGYQQARGTSLIPREKQLEIQHQLAQLSQLIAKVDTLIKSSRESEHNMYQQEKIASIREYRQAAAHAPPGVNVIPARVKPSLIQSDINYYSKEIALTIATAPLGGIVFRLAGKGLKALRALRAAKIAKAARLHQSTKNTSTAFKGSGRGLIKLIRPSGNIDDSLRAHYIEIAKSPQMATARNWYNAVAWILRQKPAASIDDIVKTLGDDVTFSKVGNIKGGAFVRGQHPANTDFWVQGNPITRYGKRVARHELMHVAAALKGQGDTVLHEIAVQVATTPENLVIGVGIMVVVGTSVYWVYGRALDMLRKIE